MYEISTMEDANICRIGAEVEPINLYKFYPGTSNKAKQDAHRNGHPVFIC